MVKKKIKQHKRIYNEKLFAIDKTEKNLVNIKGDLKNLFIKKTTH